MSDVDDFEDWKYEDLYDDSGEPDEPDCSHPRKQWCPWCEPRTGRTHRRDARRWQQQRRRWRKIDRHARDRFWQARQGPLWQHRQRLLDDEAPF